MFREQYNGFILEGSDDVTMKKYFLAVVIIMLMLSLHTNAFAATDTQPAIMLGGTRIEAGALVDKGNVYLPLRVVSEAHRLFQVCIPGAFLAPGYIDKHARLLQIPEHLDQIVPLIPQVALPGISSC
jgi:hypothetical protein